jgi:hypothetical protein
MRALHALVGAAVAVMVTGIGAHAQEQTISRGYTVVPKDGMVAQFEAALKDHVQWRADNGDPWTWGVSTVEVGERLGEYRISSFNHTWADLDAYDAGFGPEALVHWNATVAPLVESVSSGIWMTLPDLAVPPPEGAPPLAFVTITDFHLRPSQQMQFMQSIAAASEILRNSDFTGYGVWTSNITGGQPGPVVSLVSFHTSWADMAEPDPSFESVVVGEIGEEAFGEWVDTVMGAVRGTQTYTLRLRPDLGVNEN